MFTRARHVRRGLFVAPTMIVSLILSAGAAGAVPDLVPLRRAAAVAERVAHDPSIRLPAELASLVREPAAKVRRVRPKRRKTRRRLTAKQRVGFQWPVRGWITSGFGWRHRIFHHGMDIACAKMTPIRASKGGRVIYSANIPIYGKTVVIRHARGYSTLYAHMALRQVRTGARVRQGRTIGKCGSTGNSTGNHLHFEIRRNGRWFKPRPFLP